MFDLDDLAFGVTKQNLKLDLFKLLCLKLKDKNSFFIL